MILKGFGELSPENLEKIIALTLETRKNQLEIFTEEGWGR
jgi:hypothetical protein